GEVVLRSGLDGPGDPRLVRPVARRKLGLGRLVDDLPRGRQHRDPDLPHGMDLAPRPRSAPHLATRLHHSHRPARGGDDLHRHPAHALSSVRLASPRSLRGRRIPGLGGEEVRGRPLVPPAVPEGPGLLYGGGPSFGVIPIITVLEGAAVLVGVMLFVRRTSDDPRWARQRFAFVAGCVGFLIVLSAFLELAGNRGMGIAGAAFAFLLVHLYRKAFPSGGRWSRPPGLPRPSSRGTRGILYDFPGGTPRHDHGGGLPIHLPIQLAGPARLRR